MSFHSGRTGTVNTGTGLINVHNWKMELLSDVDETTNSGSGEWRERIATYKDSKGSFDVPWDDAATPESKGLTQGTTITNMLLKLGTSSVKYTVTSGIVTGLNFTVDSKTGEHIVAIVSWVGSGSVTGPA